MATQNIGCDASMAQRLEELSIPEPNSGCWLWLREPTTAGYGKIRYKGQQDYVHRVSWKVHHGAIPIGLWVLHKCDVRLCVNPTHLFLGTHLDNVADMVAKKRHLYPTRSEKSARRWAEGRFIRKNNAACGERVAGAKLRATDILVIRADQRAQSALARVYGVTQSAISRIKSGNTWKSVP